MPKLHKRIEIPGQSARDLFARIRSEMEQSLARAGVDGAKLSLRESECVVEVSHAMIAGTIRCHEGAIEVDAKLSLLATPFRSKIEGWFEAWGKKARSNEV